MEIKNPYAFLEAMGTGLSVIPTPLGPIPVLVNDVCIRYLIKQGEHRTLVCSILQLLGDVSPYENISKAKVPKSVQDFYLTTQCRGSMRFSHLLGVN